MAAKKVWEIDCPCCGAKLVIDAKLGALLSHEPPPEKKAHLEIDLGDAHKRLADEKARRDSIFEKSFEAQKTRSDVLARKFEEQYEKIKDQPVEKPHRDIDLD